ncbi:MAG: hypothetical protein ACPGLV_18670, partial [Bacteroidia bacterium]
KCISSTNHEVYFSMELYGNNLKRHFKISVEDDTITEIKNSGESIKSSGGFEYALQDEAKDFHIRPIE